MVRFSAENGTLQRRRVDHIMEDGCYWPRAGQVGHRNTGRPSPPGLATVRDVQQDLRLFPCGEVTDVRLDGVRIDPNTVTLDVSPTVLR
ncbi:hypothetical protein ABZ817_45570 [Streptomyces antimycoticus]|uniref:hypothetical protein n=1 Tax=Streptomyces antimycoticus TaxID=68175 RepID=UPI0033D5F2FB